MAGSDVTWFLQTMSIMDVEDVPLVEFTYHVFICMPGASYRGQLSSSFLCLCVTYVFRAPVNSLAL